MTFDRYLDRDRHLQPKFRPYFKVRPEVARDEELKDRVREIINEWQPTKGLMPLLEWWEVVKREVRKEAKVITRKRKRQRKQRLTFLMLLQSHLAKNITNGQFQELEQYRSGDQGMVRKGSGGDSDAGY